MSKANGWGDVVDAALGRVTGQINIWLWGYVTEGGTYIIGSGPTWHDDDRPHDLVAILPVGLEESRVLVLRPTVNPDMVEALRSELDGCDLGPRIVSLTRRLTAEPTEAEVEVAAKAMESELADVGLTWTAARHAALAALQAAREARA